MFIEIGSRLKILDPSPELIKWCKENLEMTNPEYQQKARMHLWLGNTPRTLGCHKTLSDFQRTE